MHQRLTQTLAPLAPLALALALAASPRADIKTVRVASGLASPVGVTHAPGDFERLFIIEQVTGDIEVLNLTTGLLNGAPFLDIGSRVINGGNERGLLGLAFHPDYETNGLFYVSYNDNSGDTVIAEYEVTGDPDVADFNSERIVLLVDQPQSNHNGGWIGFGPFDDYLYISIGDGGNFCDLGLGHTAGTGNSLDVTDNLLGKILRIDVDGVPYQIPPDNPFVGGAGDDEIWAYGLRNPWRCSFDRLTGDLYIADVGQDLREEINFQPFDSAGGENYGWRCEEGLTCSSFGPSSCGATTGCNCPVATPGLVPPVHDYSHQAPPSPAAFVCSVTGGYVYRGCEAPELRGSYLLADFCGNTFWSFQVVGGIATPFIDRTAEISPSQEGFQVNAVTSFGEDAAGELYIVDRGGEIFKILSRDLVDCNGNGVQDGCDVARGTSADANGNGLPDECEKVRAGASKRP